MTNNNSKNLKSLDSVYMSNHEAQYYDSIANLMSKAEKMRAGSWKDFFRNFYSAE